MKIDEFIHYYKGYGRFDSHCRIKIIHDDENLYYILFDDLNDGTSVTNASEQLASEIVNKLGLNHWNCRFFESYEEYETFDEIKYFWILDKKWIASEPSWKPGDIKIKKIFDGL